MRVAVVHNQPRACAAADEADVLVQVEAVAAALSAAGHEVDRIPCGLDLGALAARLTAAPPDVVFNLAEGLEGHERLCAVVPSFLDALGIPYTGNSAEAIFLTGNKLIAKDRLTAAGLPTPPAPARWPALPGGARSTGFVPGRYILKPVWEHGSVGMEDDVVVEASTLPDLEARLASLGERTGRACFAEAFVAGRELNVALLAGGDDGAGPEVLPPAEIDFSAFPPDKPRIVGWAAKWDEGSFEYHHTPPTFSFGADDRALLAEAARLAEACWAAFDLSGYVRVDFRFDAAGRPFILEVNTNPCLSPDAGFAAAVGQAGLTFEGAIDRIVHAALANRGTPAAVTST
jgi:D-alanine-D-alanine ligase